MRSSATARSGRSGSSSGSNDDGLRAYYFTTRSGHYYDRGHRSADYEYMYMADGGYQGFHITTARFVVPPQNTSRWPLRVMVSNLTVFERAGGGYVCDNTCTDASDSYCDDGGTGSEYARCSYGTDCDDCSHRPFLSASSSSPLEVEIGFYSWWDGADFYLTAETWSSFGTVVAGIFYPFIFLILAYMVFHSVYYTLAVLAAMLESIVEACPICGAAIDRCSRLLECLATRLRLGVWACVRIAKRLLLSPRQCLWRCRKSMPPIYSDGVARAPKSVYLVVGDSREHVASRTRTLLTLKEQERTPMGARAMGQCFLPCSRSPCMRRARG
jgi:hypothetical protein